MSLRFFRAVVAAAVCTIIVPVVAILAGLYLYRDNTASDDFSGDPAHWGQFGDFVGGIANPTVGLMTIILLVATLIMQMLALQKQREQTGKQAFEQTFFSWITAIRESINSMTVRSTPDTFLKGNAVFYYMTDTLFEDHIVADELQRQAATCEEGSDEQAKWLRAIEDLDATIWNSKSDLVYQTALVPYRMLFQLMKYVDDHEDLRDEDKVTYMRILRSTLSLENLKFIFLARNQTDAGTIHALCGKYRFLYFLPAESGSPIIPALLRFNLHTFPISSFNSKTLKALKASSPSSAEE
ncbi:hypothetical protein AP16_04079 [Mycobacterium tuberculosis M2440]|uniref:putative phage abortive infection protein n=1 Tax=Mycobacterium tuberculosis TaxID=1773 RepID=UPI000459F9FB|nr:putative phage abortive infection protein [Mycobacterium tuberculosis]KBA63632.1 hypothetical protein AO30_04069 [Mycobacterium tuberculosis M1615]KBD74229.1 hypothetical protein AP16_04079 [Mycobacterium tuberculosis M2440]KEB46159.1 hypothetical protein AP56_04074 [Mycobacterium tuberculosis H1964]